MYAVALAWYKRYLSMEKARKRGERGERREKKRKETNDKYVFIESVNISCG